MFWVRDPVSLKIIANDRHTYPKRPETYSAICVYGQNVVATDGDEWRRHRDATKAAFGESNNRLVWIDSMRVTKEWFAVLDSSARDDDGAIASEVHEVMTRIALLIISSAGFGRTVSFVADSTATPPPGYRMAFRPALVTTVHMLGLKIIAPRWAYHLPIKALKDTDMAYEELKKHLLNMIDDTKAALTGRRSSSDGKTAADLFKRLIEANEGEGDGKAKLSESELLSNTYTFLLAGHETTANALSFACALLAMHPEVQKKIQQEVDEVWPNGLPEDGSESYREDMPRLRYTEAVFRETTRLFPAEPRLSKMVVADGLLKGRRRDGEKYDVVVPEGSTIWLDIWATHMSQAHIGGGEGQTTCAFNSAAQRRASVGRAKLARRVPETGIKLRAPPLGLCEAQLAKLVGDYNAKYSPYGKTGTSIIASIPLVRPVPMFWVRDPVSLKIIANDRHTYPKRPETYSAICVYGQNVVATDGDEWRRHRDATKAAFGESNNRLVWIDSMRVTKEWFAVLDSSARDDDGAIASEVHEVMTRIALLIISSAGFGRTVSFVADSTATPPPGYRMAFRPALVTTVHMLGLKIIAPRWAYHLPIKALKDTDMAYEELKKHLLNMIDDTKAALTGRRSSSDGKTAADLFKRLIEANEGEGDGKAKLSESELLSNTYTFLLAGHETTANALSFACALLAMHPEVQKKIQQEVDEVWPNGLPEDGSESYREDMPRLRYTEAVFRETTRLFPAEPRLSKMVVADGLLKGRRRDGEKYDVVVPEGSTIWLDIWATHMSPDYWGEDVQEFRPERFFDTETYKWPRDAYLPFMIGPRSCMGQRFAQLEGICVLSHIMRKYEIRVPKELESASLEEQKKAFLSFDIRVALTARKVNVRFVPRM